MSDIAIQVRGLGKEYRIGHQTTRKTFRETINSALMAPLRRLRQPLNPAGEESFWALKDVNFDVHQGEVVGIIGRNGAGKSTLLKILSRITEPTIGEIDINGRIGSLLEVGTGFHPELTGRENVYLNGAILGMTKSEIRRQFDAIVDFAGTEKFLDTPVKHYSSGMYVRLAFAVAAHLNPEILIVDEVLAVGDAEFQKKCIGKMKDVASEGRTVLFVSHNMAALTRLCETGILLEKGRLLVAGSVNLVLSQYLRSGLHAGAERSWPTDRRPGNNVARLSRARVCSIEGKTIESIEANQPVAIEMEYEVIEAGNVLVPNLHFFSEDGTCLFVTQEIIPEWRGRPRPPGIYVSTALVPPNLLSEGTIVVGVALSTFNPMIIHFYEQEVITFQIVEPKSGESARGDYHGPIPGAVRPLLDWKLSYTREPKSSLDGVLVEGTK